MAEPGKDDALAAAAVMILLATALIEWNVYSWLILAAVILMLAAWYFRGSGGVAREAKAGKKESA
ncbi:MAG: hypothetical protein PHF51_03220 [Candidatus ainarchaeum sp.]|nr:hypothetical protein [Candidatus ainarchaeum sp.]